MNDDIGVNLYPTHVPEHSPIYFPQFFIIRIEVFSLYISNNFTQMNNDQEIAIYAEFSDNYN